MTLEGPTSRESRDLPVGDPTSYIRVRVFVEGRVQRVSFRDSTWREADRLGIRGWVRNLSDGRVEAVYEGTQDAVEEMLLWTRRGPEWAQVTNLEVHDEPPRGERGFLVK